MASADFKVGDIKYTLRLEMKRNDLRETPEVQEWLQKTVDLMAHWMNTRTVPLENGMILMHP